MWTSAVGGNDSLRGHHRYSPQNHQLPHHRRRCVASELDLNKLWLYDETTMAAQTPYYAAGSGGVPLLSQAPYQTPVVPPAHLIYHSPSALLPLSRLAKVPLPLTGSKQFAQKCDLLPYDDDFQEHYATLPVSYVYAPVCEVYYFDSSCGEIESPTMEQRKPQEHHKIRCPTPDYSPSESPSNRTASDSTFSGGGAAALLTRTSCSFDSDVYARSSTVSASATGASATTPTMTSEPETDSGSSGYASSSISQKCDNFPTLVSSPNSARRPAENASETAYSTLCYCAECSQPNASSHYDNLPFQARTVNDQRRQQQHQPCKITPSNQSLEQSCSPTNYLYPSQCCQISKSSVKAVSFCDPPVSISADSYSSAALPSMRWSVATFDTLRRRTQRMLKKPAAKLRSISQRIDHKSLMKDRLPELQQRLKAGIETLRAIPSREIFTYHHELSAPRKTSTTYSHHEQLNNSLQQIAHSHLARTLSNDTELISAAVAAENETSAAANSNSISYWSSAIESSRQPLYHSFSQPDISFRAAEMVRDAGNSSDQLASMMRSANVRQRPPLPPNPPSRDRLLRYSNVPANRRSLAVDSLSSVQSSLPYNTHHESLSTLRSFSQSLPSESSSSSRYVTASTPPTTTSESKVESEGG
ncbi:unnamed protein product [Anisakis simplex]|uniref:DH domain-containing protein n=1 Tax=Anisakis simplex TaxID=6269 RepID=A0A0M3K5E2_ANISI|nr:unnamed protein product [Anisakis simplex]